MHPPRQIPNQSTSNTGHKPDAAPLTRDELIALSAPVLRRLSRRLASSRFRSRKTDTEYLAFVRETVSLLEVYVSIAPSGDTSRPGGLAYA